MATEKQSNDNKRDKQSAAKKRVTKLAAPPQAQAQAPSPELVQLALVDPGAVAPSVIMALQRSHGNQTVQRLISQSQANREVETAEALTPVKQAVRAVTHRSKPSQSAASPSPASDPILAEYTEAESLSALWQAGEEYVPPIAPPALPPDDNNDPRHKVGSPFRHLDGFSNRKSANKYRLGPTSPVSASPQKEVLASKFASLPDDTSRQAPDSQ